MAPLIHRTLMLSAAIVPLTASLVLGQYRIDNGSANDANNRIGSGGYNDSRLDPRRVDARIGGLAGNYIVTGNVTGGREFRGNVPYTNQYAFRGALGSADFDPFIRDSSGIGQIRGGYGANGAINPQPFFGGQTVATPPGFVRSQAANGTFVPTRPTQVLPNDGRTDYGGASRSVVTQSLIDSRQQYGNGDVPPSNAAPYAGQNAAAVNSPLQLSEFTTLARQRRDLFGTANTANRADSAADVQNNRLPGGPTNPFDVNRRPDAQDNTNSTTPDANDNRAPNADRIDSQPVPDDNAQPGDTGQSLTRRPAARVGALQNNTQYAALRDRLDQAHGNLRNNGNSNDANGPRQTIGGPINSQTVNAGGGVSTGQSRSTTKLPGTQSPDSQTPDSQTPDAAAADDTNAAANNAATGNGTTGDRPATNLPTGNRATGDQPAGASGADDESPKPVAGPDTTPPDTLNLPRPGGNAPAAKPMAASPVLIKSLAMGVKDQKLAKMLSQAEEEMRAGKFGSAIDTYEHAEEVASDDPLIFMGRSIAELGGGYFRNAEVHLRQAFAADPSLLYAKFDLRAMIGDDRLNQLAAKLGDVANANEKDPGPLMLLGFIYYNGGMEGRAARALDMAQLRANGKDKEVDALRKTWALDTPADTENAGNTENK